ncbi:hypothetical protein [Kaistia granuli]|uniref:hypothetical protein n=1 Tax=Kaistia granuli TaxID=363259 RepID=UPI00036CE5B2|nr:hypothetical protein [Kaistia granuli]
MLAILTEANPIQRTIDGDRNHIVIVTLLRGEKALLLEEDFNRIIAQGYSPLWRMARARDGSSYVAIYGRSGRAAKFRPAIADLVVERKRSQPLPIHLDNNPLNLRRDNLLIPQRQSGGQNPRPA